MGLPFSGLTRLVCCLAVFVALLVSLVLLMKDDKTDWDEWISRQLLVADNSTPSYDPGAIVIEGIEVYPVQPKYDYASQLLFFSHIPRTAGGTFSSLLAAVFDLPTIHNQSSYGFPIFRWTLMLDYTVEEWRKWRVLFTHEDFYFSHFIPPEIDVAHAVFLRDPAMNRRSMFDWHMRMTRYWLYPGIDKWIGSEHYPVNYQVEWLAGCTSTWPFSKAAVRYLKRCWADPEEMLHRAKIALANTTFLGITERWNESVCLFYYSHRLPPKVEGVDWQQWHKTNRSRSPYLTEQHKAVLGLEYRLYDWALKLFDARIAWMKKDFEMRRSEMLDLVAEECRGVLV